jgi:glutamate/tyrosine decarboxylase-like PLP-dependent enzyme
VQKAAFLGPKGENAAELERLLLDVLHDHVFWRRNYHPGDPRMIDERDRRSEEYADTAGRMRDELFQILSELKRGAPLYSPRQIAHMVSDPTLPAIVGYFAGLLYNQNNVVAEVAPETVRKERAFVAALARMVGFPEMLPEVLADDARDARAPFSWGHLCSGGTLANLEALWVARNVRLYAPAVRLLAATEPRFAHLADLSISGARLRDRSTAELLNLTPAEATEVHLRVRAHLTEAGREEAMAFEHAVPSVRKAGLAGLLGAYNAAFPSDPARPPVVLISQAAHYGWGKAMDVVGLGDRALRKVPVDGRVRVDVDALGQAVRDSARRGESVLMVISIAGTTEEGSVDPVHRVHELREALAADRFAFWHHCDAAFGAYLATVLPRDDAGRPRPYDGGDESISALTDDLMEPDVYRALAAISLTDSVTIDPHKMGYVPYPAGAILLRDYHARDALSFAASYLPDDERAGFSGFLGRWTLEGSRPGAPAVSAYLSQAVVPLDEGGHGVLVRDCLHAMRTLVRSLRARFDADAPALFVPLAEPDSVGLCFTLVPRGGVDSLAALNRFTKQVWTHVAVDGRDELGHYPFILSRTEVDVAHYRRHLEAMLGPAALERPDADALMLLRVIIMNPFLREWSEREPGFDDIFCEYLEEVVKEAGNATERSGD